MVWVGISYISTALAGYELVNEPWAGDIYGHFDQLAPREYGYKD